MAKINKNRIRLGDIVFVNMKNVSMYGNCIGKVMGTHEGTKVVVLRGDGFFQRVFINRCSHANETQRKHYFKDLLKYG